MNAVADQHAVVESARNIEHRVAVASDQEGPIVRCPLQALPDRKKPRRIRIIRRNYAPGDKFALLLHGHDLSRIEEVVERFHAGIGHDAAARQHSMPMKKMHIRDEVVQFLAEFALELQQDKGFAELIASISLARNIAIVGSGPSLKGARQGAKIDAHDLIVRTNFPPIGGVFAEDVGSRADIVFNWRPPTDYKISEATSRRGNVLYRGALIVQASPNFNAHYAPFTADDLATVGVSRFARLPPTIMQLILDLSYAYPTTGFIAIVFIALLLDRPVSIFGFDFFETYGMHFWSSRRRLPYSEHEPKFEKRMAVNMLKVHFGVV
ncbi:sialyltransferase family protein [Ostertagia ostertagi]